MAQNTLEVRRDIERIRAELDQTLDALGDHVKPSRIAERRTRGIRRTFTTARERVMGTASSAGDGLHGAQSQLADTAGGAVDRAKETPQWVAQETRGNPLVAGMVAFGVGMLLGSLAPPTEAERHAVDAMSDQLEPVRQAAAEVAGSVREQAVGATREAAEHVKGEVQHAAQEVGTSAQQSASEVKDQAQDGIQQVKEARQS
jgi:ElaB/YqjD/DUF883 family membrane-anchored ribosome-binding protein